MKNRLPQSKSSASAFTLIEIMVVLAVIAIIATMAVPALNGVLKGSKMTQASDELERDLARAHAAAQRENTPIEFRFYLFSDPEQPNSAEAFRAYQAVKRVLDFEDHTNVIAYEPIFPVKMLPPGIVFSEDTKYSSMFQLPNDPNGARDHGGGLDDSIPRLDDVDYKAFRFRPDGSTSLASEFRAKNWFVTIQKESVTGDSDLPPDFVTFQVDAYNGQIRRYEKGL